MNLFKQFIVATVGNGQATSFWTYYWQGNSPLHLQNPNLCTLTANQDISRIYFINKDDWFINFKTMLTFEVEKEYQSLAIIYKESHSTWIRRIKDPRNGQLPSSSQLKTTTIFSYAEAFYLILQKIFGNHLYHRMLKFSTGYATTTPQKI